MLKSDGDQTDPCGESICLCSPRTDFVSHAYSEASITEEHLNRTHKPPGQHLGHIFDIFNSSPVCHTVCRREIQEHYSCLKILLEAIYDESDSTCTATLSKTRYRGSSISRATILHIWGRRGEVVAVNVISASRQICYMRLLKTNDVNFMVLCYSNNDLSLGC